MEQSEREVRMEVQRPQPGAGPPSPVPSLHPSTMWVLLSLALPSPALFCIKPLKA